MSTIGGIADQAAGGAVGTDAASPSGSNSSADGLGGLFDRAVGDVARAKDDGGKTASIAEQPGGGNPKDDIGGASGSAGGAGGGNPYTDKDSPFEAFIAGVRG